MPGILHEHCMLSHFSRVQLCATPWTAACQAPRSMDPPGKNTGLARCFLLQGIFPTQGSNSHLLTYIIILMFKTSL